MRKRSADRSRRDFLVSIHPRFVETIFSGRKTVELRRRFSDRAEANSLVFIYGTSPMRSLIGTARIVDVKRMPKACIWRQFGKQACVSKDEFEAYFSGIDSGYAILLDRVTRFREAIGADDLRQFGFVPPQSFRYVPKEFYSLLGHARVQGSY
jgi:predicted transcriptional regulator